MNVLICDPVSPKGIALLQQRPEFKVTVLDKRLPEAELLPLVAETEAMVVRSETKVTRKVIEAAPKLKVVGRAGVGVDNVDVETATRRGRFPSKWFTAGPCRPCGCLCLFHVERRAR